MTRRKHGHGIRWRSVYLWHRYLGLAAALFAAMLAVSGVLLNHADALRLDQSYLRSSWLLRWYGLQPDADWRCYLLDTDWICANSMQLTYNGRRVLNLTEQPLGIMEISGLRVLAFRTSLLLLTTHGQTLERITAAQGLPIPIRRIGRDVSGRLILQHHAQSYSADMDTLQWTPTAERGIQWSAPVPPPPALRTHLENNHSVARLSWERVLLDLHSGRLLGRYGIYIMDGAALLLLLLAASGLIVYTQRRSRK